MTGTLLYVSQGRIGESNICEIIDQQSRERAGPTVPAHGLYLNKVFYKPEYKPE
jgi:tRNA pseudouridine38-40 synthase